MGFEHSMIYYGLISRLGLLRFHLHDKLSPEVNEGKFWW